VVLAVVAPLLVSCGGGAVVVAVVALNAGGSGGGKAAPPPATVTLTVPRDSGASGYVELSYLIADRTVKGLADPRVRILPEYRLQTSASWLPMSEAPIAPGEGTRALSLGQHAFIWNTLIDIGGGISGRIAVRIGAEYEDSEGRGRRWRSNEAELSVDNRLAATVFGGEVGPAPGAITRPVDMRADGDGFLVASRGANIVERVDMLGGVVRLAGLGVPGTATLDGSDPGAA